MDVYSILIPVLIAATVVLVISVPILVAMWVVDWVRALRRREGRTLKPPGADRPVAPS